MDKIQNEERNNPFYIMDISNVAERIKIWKELLPRIEIFYACKTNPNEKIIEATMKENTCYDVASLGEIKRIMTQGVTPDKMIYANPIKDIKHI